jgi:multidrug efflux pump
MAGISGQLYRQFALTIAASTIISAFNSLTLSPALGALLLKPHKPADAHGGGGGGGDGHAASGHAHAEALPPVGIAIIGGLIAYLFLAAPVGHMVGIDVGGHGAEPTSSAAAVWGLKAALFVAGAVVGYLLSKVINLLLGWLFRGFNKAFDLAIAAYGKTVAGLLRVSVIVLLVYGGLIALTLMGFSAMPKGFIPEQDKGYLVLNAQLPDGAALGRTDGVIQRLSEIVRKTEGVAYTIDLPGYSTLLSTNISNVGGMFIILEPFEERAGKHELSGPEVAKRLRAQIRDVLDARVGVFPAPPVDGLGSTGGFKLQVQDRRGAGLRSLAGAVQNLAAQGNADPRMGGLFSSFSVTQPQIFVQIDRDKAKAQRVALDDINKTLQASLGAFYVNDFTFNNRNWQVNVPADRSARLRVEDIGKLEVRSAGGERVPLRTLVDIRNDSGPAVVNHYNLYPSAEVNGNPAPGVSSGEAITIMDQLGNEQLPSTMGYEWTELTLQQLLAEKDVLTKLVFPLAVVFVFLVLAAQYESWSLPLSIILIVPMCILAAVVGLMAWKFDVNIFTQIGLVVLIGLAAKNAILIVEFAKQLQDQGKPLREATVDACRLRLRPILMTSFAFILGVVPLVLAKGAGAEMRQTLGVAVFAGMLGVTVFGIFFTPVFYYVIRWLTGGRAAAGAAASTPGAAADGRPQAPATVTAAEDEAVVLSRA